MSSIRARAASASWLYQQLVRVLFRLDVRDTQVGLKVFRREVAEQVLPLLLVKRFAFDLELLAVSRALGFGRIEELPIRLDYRFTGSGVRSLAVLRALVDTAAIFYRLRILRYYQRQAARSPGRSAGRGRAAIEPLVSVVHRRTAVQPNLDYPSSRCSWSPELTPAAVRAGASARTRRSRRVPRARRAPAGNWIAATVPFLGRERGRSRRRPARGAASGLGAEPRSSGRGRVRLGGGSLYFRSMPGNLRYVADFPAETIVVAKERYEALDRDVPLDELVGELDRGGDRVLYTPETVSRRRARRRSSGRICARPSPTAVAAARELRRRGLRALRLTTLLPLVLAAFLVAGPFALLAGGRCRVRPGSSEQPSTSPRSR